MSNNYIKKFECRMSVEKAVPAISKLFTKGTRPIGGIIRFSKEGEKDMLSKFEYTDVEIRIRKITNRTCSVQVYIPDKVIDEIAHRAKYFATFSTTTIININEDGNNVDEPIDSSEFVRSRIMVLTDEYIVISKRVEAFCDNLPALSPVEKKKPVEKAKPEKKKRR